MTNQANKPVETLRDGSIKVSIFRNHGKNGAFYSIKSPIRSYTDQSGTWHDTYNLNGDQAEKAAKLLKDASNVVAKLIKNN